MVSVGVASNITRDVKKSKNHDQTFQLENHYVELADETKNNCVALKRRDAEMCQLDVDGNYVLVTLKKTQLITSCLHDIFSVKSRNYK